MQSNPRLINQIFLFVIVFITSFAVAFSYWIWENTKNDRLNDMVSTGMFLNSYYQLSFYQRELGLRAIGERMLSIKGPDEKSQRLEIALNALNVHNEFMAIGLVDTTGQIITFTGSLSQDNLPNLATSEKTRRTFEQVKKAKALIIGEVYYFDEISNWILPIRVPLLNENGQLIAVNTSAISIEKLMEELISFNINPNYHIHFVNGTFNTTQLYYPLAKASYESVLHKPSALYSDEIINQRTESSTSFEGRNLVDDQEIIGIRTNRNAQDHYVEVIFSRGLLWSDFRESLIIVLSIYAFVIVLLVFLFIYIKSSLRKYEHQLKTERDYSEKIIQSTSALVVGIDNHDNCTFINSATEKVTGYNRADLIGQNWWQTMYPTEEYKQVERLFTELPDGNLKNYEMVLTTKSGSRRNISWNSIRFFDRRGKLQEVIGLGIDITDQKEAERGLQSRQANLKAIVESTQNSIALVDTQLKLVDFNTAFKNYCKDRIGVELEKGMSVDELVEGPDTIALIAFIKKALKGEKLSKLVDYQSTTGPMYLSINFNPVYQRNEVTGVSMFLQDLTELKNAQDELKRYSENLEAMVEERSVKIRQANKELQRSNEELKLALEELHKAQYQLVQAEKMASLGVLSAGVGHEINNPLNFIKGGVNALAIQLKKTEEKVHAEAIPFIEIINEGVNRATAIVKSLSHFSRDTTEQNEKCDVHQILDNCLLILNSRLKHRVEVEKEYNIEAVILQGNEGKLHQAFLNVLSNAEQAILQKGTIRIVTALVGKTFRISISDNGVGISRENMQRISDPFFTTKEPGKGTGLGLSITYKIVADHKGKVSVTSDLNKGTEFVFLFPI